MEQLKARRNAASKEIGALMARKELETAESRKAEVRTIGDRIAELDRVVDEAASARDALLLSLPNLLHNRTRRILGKERRSKIALRKKIITGMKLKRRIATATGT